MEAEEVLKRWGAAKLGIEQWEDVRVEFGFEEGYECCPPGSEDPYCYCTFDMPSYSYVEVRAPGAYERIVDFGYAEILQEMLELANA